ncbi:MAG: cupin domain-containing protein [Planctomycetota bacterium]|jgi:mannose-6-phosphate isomerase-like protein (cupin superfamily)
MSDDLVKRFTDCEFYREGGRNAYYKIIPKGAMGNVAAGYVVVEGPETTPANAHTDWEQAYLVIGGSGTLVLGGERIPVGAGMVARIPLETEHYVEVAEGETLEYVYVNRFL